MEGLVSRVPFIPWSCFVVGEKCNKKGKRTAVLAKKKMPREVKAQDREQCSKDNARGILGTGELSF